MKLLVLTLLVSVFVAGKSASSATTETWNDDEANSFTLSPSEKTPMHKGPVKVSLSGPFETSTSSTTEDPYLTLILRKLIEDGLKNEIDNENIQTKKASVKTPLVYMTPPSQSQSQDTKNSGTTAFDDDIDGETSTTTDPTFSEESTTTDASDDIDDSGESTKLSSKSNNTFQKSTQVEGITNGQYAPKYQNYFSQNSSPNPMQTEVRTDDGKEEKANGSSESNESDEISSASSSPPPPMIMDKVIFDNPRTKTDQGQDETSNQPRPQPQFHSSEESYQNSDANDTATPPSNVPDTFFTTTPASIPQNQQQPIYYFFLRPKPRAPIGQEIFSDGLSGPRSYPTMDNYWNTYPERRIMRTPFIAQDYNENQIPSASQAYTYPSMASSSIDTYNPYSYQTAYSSPAMTYQSLPQSYYPPTPSPTTNMMTYQYPTQSYNQGPYFNQMYPQQSSGFGFNRGYYSNGRNPNPFIPRYFNYQYPNSYSSRSTNDGNNNFLFSPMAYNNLGMSQRYYTF